MAIVRALKSGNWSDPTVWNTGALPTSADDVYSNTFAITIDTSPTVISIRNSAATGVTAGGTFTVASGNRTITASIFAATTTCLIVDVPNGDTTIVGNVTGGTATSIYGIIHKNGALTVNGNVASGSGASAHGIDVQGNAVSLTVSGNCTATYGNAIINRVAATINVQNGTYAGSSVATSQPCLNNVAGGSINVLNGTCVPGGSTGSHAVVNSGSGYVEINTPGVNYTASASSILVNSGSGIAYFTAASLTGGTSVNVVGISNQGAGSLYVYANVNGGSASAAHGIISGGSAYTYIQGNCVATVTAAYVTTSASTGTSDIIGNCTGGTGTSIYAVSHGGGGTVNISGNCTAGIGSSAIAVYNSANGVINITGSCTANAGDGVYNAAGGSISITGNCSGSGTANRHGVHNASTGTITISGTCTGGNANPSYGAYNASTGRIYIVGMCVANSTSSTSFGAYNASTGTLEHWGTILASSVAAGIGSVSGGTLLLTGPFSAASNGWQPVSASKWQWAQVNAGFTYYENYKPDLTVRQLLSIESFASGTPAVSNVRKGTVYGANNSLTGTLAVPPAGSVLLGVPVDNTTGTATITATDIRSALGMSSANLDTQLSGLATSQGVLASGQQTINTNVLSRLASADYTAPPTAAIIRSEMDINSVKLANLDATVSSRLAGSSYSAPPSATANASAVRTELATELARLDAAISTRLAASSYSTPPTAAAIATAVNSALDRTGFSLTTAERQAIATAVEQSILNENDGQAILNAIVGAIGNQNIDQIALVAAIRADLERTGGTLATRSTLTAAQVRTELSPELGNLDATVSSRLPSSGYTSPPSAASIATAVWSAATRTLTTAIDNSSTIAAAVWSAVSRTITGGTVDTLTNAPTVPTPSQIASQVRTELSTELSRIDATVSSRLAPGGTLARVTLADTATTLTNAPDVPTGSEIAKAVREELTPELERVANCATVETTGDQIAALS